MLEMVGILQDEFKEKKRSMSYSSFLSYILVFFFHLNSVFVLVHKENKKDMDEIIIRKSLLDLVEEKTRSQCEISVNACRTYS